jgi:hypothetical protein
MGDDECTALVPEEIFHKSTKWWEQIDYISGHQDRDHWAAEMASPLSSLVYQIF